jgi:transposase-like protein
MKLYPGSVIEFEEMFPTDQACYEYLRLVRWPNGFVCTNCSHTEAWNMKGNVLRCKQCRRRISVTAGTIFQDLRKPIRLMFQTMWYVVCQKQGVNAVSLQQIIGLGSYQTAWVWLHKLRTAMVRPGRDKLSGTVEVDETFIGGSQSGKRGRGAEKKELVLVAVERTEKGMGRIRLKHIANASGQVLEQAVTELVEPGSIVSTDGWRGYSRLGTKGYTHIVVSHQENEPGDDPTPFVHRIASLLKRWLLGTHQGGQQFSHLHYYLDEFTFRFNRRKSTSRGKLFLRLVQQALQVNPAPLASLQVS